MAVSSFPCIQSRWTSPALLDGVFVAGLAKGYRWIAARVGASRRRSARVRRPLVVVGYETFVELPREWLTLSAANQSDTPILRCDAHILAFGPLHRGYYLLKE